MNINEFLNDLANNSSRNYKIEKLEEHRGDQTLREVIRLALDPFTQFYIRKIPSYTPNTTGHGASIGSMLPSLYELRERLVTGNAAIEHLTNILEALKAEDAKVMERIIQKDLKCGVQVSTANVVWTGLIHEYPVMLCSQFDQKLVDKVQFPALVQLKMDGMRFNAIVRDGKVEYRSRNGKEIQLLGNLDADFITLAGDVDCVFDGELLVVEGNKILDRQTGNGILNKANKGTISEKEAKMVRATVWDVIPYLYFVDGECPTPYGTRFNSLELLMKKAPSKVFLVESKEVATMEEASVLFEKYLAAGQEGIILKDKRGIWEDKRSKSQIKFKGELECDLKIVGVEEGTGKYAGMLGAILCESSDGVIKVSVGSGFTDDQRKQYWKENVVDLIAAIKYNMRIKNKAGEESLFLPIVLEIRFDKTVADSSKDIK
jgi:hypothetical protein